MPILLESPIIPQEKFVSHYTIERDPYADDDSEDEWEDEHGVVINDVDSDSNSDDELEDMFILYLSFCLLNFTFFLVKYAMTHMMFFYFIHSLSSIYSRVLNYL